MCQRQASLSSHIMLLDTLAFVINSCVLGLNSVHAQSWQHPWLFPTNSGIDSTYSLSCFSAQILANFSVGLSLQIYQDVELN